MLRKRIITALLGIPLLVAAVWFDTPLPWFSVLAAVWCLLAVFEFYRVTPVTGVPLLTGFGLVFTLLFVLSPHFSDVFPLPELLTSAIVLSLIVLVFCRRKEGIFTSWAWTMAGILYVGWLLSFLVALRLEAGREWVFLALFVTFGSDTAAYFVGKALGRYRLAPGISPGKTWEGAIAGAVAAMAVSIVAVILFGLPISYGQAIALGLLVSVLGQLGDLVESLLKRNMGVKESGRLMPGHGGLLDRMDSVVFAGVTVYYFFLTYSNGWLNW